MYLVSIVVQNVMLTLNQLNQTTTEISNLFDDKYFLSSYINGIYIRQYVNSSLRTLTKIAKNWYMTNNNQLTVICIKEAIYDKKELVT